MAKKDYDVNYIKMNCRRVFLLLNKKTDADILQHLDAQTNRNGYLKQLIRDDIKKNKKG